MYNVVYCFTPGPYNIICRPLNISNAPLQDAISSLYYILQRHGAHLASDLHRPYNPDQDAVALCCTHAALLPVAVAVPGGGDGGYGGGRGAVMAAADAMVIALKGKSLVREALASAAVCLWAAAAAAAPLATDSAQAAPPAPTTPSLATATSVVASFAAGLFLGRERLQAGERVVPAGAGEGAAAAAAPVGCVEAALASRGSCLALEVDRFSEVGSGFGV